MNETVIIKELDKIWGRDAIYLDKIEFDGTHTVTLTGEMNGSLCENIKGSEWIAYELTFFVYTVQETTVYYYKKN